MRSLIKKLSSLIFLAFLFSIVLNLASAVPVFAQSNLLSGQEGMPEMQAVFGEPEDVRITIVKIINIVLSLLAIIFLILVVVAGFKYMTAAGNEDKTRDAIKQIQQAVIGLLIILTAWGVTRFILIRLLAAASGQNYLYFD
jgi:cytochrome bd-type quinol oxidase subunit 2